MERLQEANEARRDVGCRAEGPRSTFTAQQVLTTQEVRQYTDGNPLYRLEATQQRR